MPEFLTSLEFLMAVRLAGDVLLALLALWMVVALIVGRKVPMSSAALGLALGIAMHASPALAADTKITNLTSGDPALTGDEIPVNRVSGGPLDRKITAGTVRYLLDTMVNGTSVTASPAANQNDYSPTGWDDTEPAKATLLRLTPTATVIITGMAGGSGNDGRFAVVCNATDPSASAARLVILPHESTSSTAANRFSFNDRFARFLAAGDCMQLMYDDTSDRWRNIARDNFRTAFDIWNDFGGQGVGVTTGSMGEVFSCDQTGTASTCQQGTFLLGDGTDNPIGVVSADTGTTTTGRGYVAVNGGSSRAEVVPAEGHAMFMARVGQNDLSDATDTTQMYCGFHDGGAGTSPTDGVYWFQDSTVSGDYRFAVEGATTQSITTATGFTVATTRYDWIGFYVNGDWSNVDFFHSTDGVSWVIDGAQTGANIPVAAETMDVACGYNKTAGSTSKEMFIDFMAYRLGALLGG